MLTKQKSAQKDDIFNEAKKTKNDEQEKYDNRSNKKRICMEKNQEDSSKDNVKEKNQLSKKQKIENDNISQCFGNDVVMTSDCNNNNRNIAINEEKKFEIITKYINGTFMKRLDQYLEQLNKDKQEIPAYLNEDSISVLDSFQTIEEILQSNQINLKMALIARYQFYLWLKKKDLIPQVENKLTKKNIHFYYIKLYIFYTMKKISFQK